MFEDCLPAPKKDGRPAGDKVVAVLAALFFHILLGLAVYHGRFTVKIISFGKEEVRNVVIVPPLKVTIPKVVGGRGLVSEPVARPLEGGGLPAGGGGGGGPPRPGADQPEDVNSG
jgi:hypothetical protein